MDYGEFDEFEGGSNLGLENSVFQTDFRVFWL